MSLMAYYVDGELQTSNTSSDSLSKSNSDKNAVNSDTFLTLLVAEMQNQDPLEPTSNTEWVSQYATFTQVEQMGEMADSMDVLRANSLVGKEVIMKVTSVSTGETSYVRGVVDYITMEEGKPLLNIGGSSYSLDDLDTVASDDYFDCYDFYTKFTGMMDALPSVNQIDKSYKTTMGEIFDLYDNMTDKQKAYMQQYAPTYLTNYESYIKKMEDLGITFTSKKEDETTLDTLLDSFNTKMEELMKQISGISTSISSSSTSGSGSSSGDTSNTTDNTAGTTGNTDSTAGTTGNADSAAGGSEGTTDGTGETDNDTTENNENAAEEAGTTTPSTEAGNEDSDISDDTLDKITEDI